MFMSLLLAWLPGDHVSDFTKTDSPNGLSRRAFVSVPTDPGWTSPCPTADDQSKNPYIHSRTDFKQQFWGGYYRFANSNGTALVIADLGTGLGSAQLPGPLVAGGAFVVTRPDGSAYEGGFGPYATPFRLQADLALWSQYAAQNRYTNAAAPPSSGGNSVWLQPYGVKTAGVVLEVVDAVAGTVTVNLGVYTSASGHTLSIYDSAGTLLPGTNAIPLSGASVPAAGDSWSVEALVNAASLRVNLYKNGNFTTPIATLDSLQSPAAQPWDIDEVRSGALRFAGMVSPSPAGRTVTVDVSKITVSASNIPTFDGPATSVGTPPAPADLPLLKREGTTLHLDASGITQGMPASAGAFEATGVNVPNLMMYFTGIGGTPAYGRHVLEQLATKTHHRVVRFFAFGIGPAYVKSGAVNGWPEWPVVNYPLYELWEANEAGYLAAFDEALSYASSLGIYLVPCVIPGVRDPYCHEMETQTPANAPAVRVRDVFSDALCNQTPFNPECEAVHRANALVSDIASTIALRYGDDPGILFWETGNEWNSQVDHDLVAFPASPDWSETWTSPLECAAAVDFVAGILHANDPIHLVGTGHANVEALYEEGTTGCQSPAAHEQALRDVIPASIDLISLHNYPSELTDTSCIGWGPNPYDTWREYFRSYLDYGADIVVDETPSDPGRPVYIGEINANRFEPYDGVTWPGVIEAFSREDEAESGPLFPLTMQWQWMETPDLAYINDHDLVPAELASPPACTYQCQACTGLDTRGLLFEEFAQAATGRPRVLALGYGTTWIRKTIASAREIRAYVYDVQGDVEEVTAEIWNTSGSPTNVTLSPQGGNLWTYNDSVTIATVQDRVGEIRAVDQEGNESSRSPWLTMSVRTPDPFTPVLPSVFVNNAGANQTPRIHEAGMLGFEPVGDDSVGRRWCLVVHLTNASGGPLGPSSGYVLSGRFNPTGTLAGGSSWSSTGLFQFNDDGIGMDLVANDGWWLASTLLSSTDVGTLQGHLATGELLFELKAAKPPPVVSRSDLWPRMTVH